MSRLNVSRHGGDQWQARWFWLNAVKILDPTSAISAVSWERGPKSVDDVVIDYQPARSFVNRNVDRDYVQCKWHVSPGMYGYALLTEPKFINADTQSWLQRAYAAYKETEGQAVRFVMKTNSDIDHTDTLRKVHRAEHGGIDVDKLFEGKTTRSATGAMRACWCVHLGITEDELRKFAPTLTFSNISQSLDELRDSLNERLRYAGLRPEPESQASFKYDGLIVKLHQRGEVAFDGRTFNEMCDREDLWSPDPPTKRPYTVGVRSFMHRFDAMEDRCDDFLDLVPNFDGRFLRTGNEWHENIDNKVTKFLHSVASEHKSLQVVVDAHVSIAAAVGRELDVKSGRELRFEQRGANSQRQWWHFDDGRDGAPFVVSADVNDSDDVVVTLSATHDVTRGVEAYCAEHLADDSRIDVRPTETPGPNSIAGGAHAWRVALQVAQAIRAVPGVPGRAIHLFAAAPNALVTFLGQQLGLGPVTVYEWDLGFLAQTAENLH